MNLISKIVIIILVLFCMVQDKTVDTFKLSTIETKDKISIDDQFYLWYELTAINKIKMIIKMLDLSDEQLKYQIEYSFDDDTLLARMSQELIKVKDCADNNGYVMYLSYESDLQIGIVLLECLNQYGFFRD